MDTSRKRHLRRFSPIWKTWMAKPMHSQDQFNSKWYARQWWVLVKFREKTNVSFSTWPVIFNITSPDFVFFRREGVGGRALGHPLPFLGPVGLRKIVFDNRTFWRNKTKFGRTWALIFSNSNTVFGVLINSFVRPYFTSEEKLLWSMMTATPSLSTPL